MAEYCGRLQGALARMDQRTPSLTIKPIFSPFSSGCFFKRKGTWNVQHLTQLSQPRPSHISGSQPHHSHVSNEQRRSNPSVDLSLRCKLDYEAQMRCQQNLRPSRLSSTGVCAITELNRNEDSEATIAVAGGCAHDQVGVHFSGSSNILPSSYIDRLL